MDGKYYKSLVEAFNEAIEAANDAIFILDSEARVWFWNSAASSLFGYSRQEIAGTQLQKLVVLQEEYDALFDAYKAFQMRGQEKAVGRTVEMEARRKDGSKFDLELSASAFQYRKTWYSLNIARDISERKRAKRELENSLQQYWGLAEEAPIGIISCDVKGKIIYVNSKALDILGSTSMEETKKINMLTFPLLVKYGFSEKLTECFETKKFAIHELHYKSKWGKKVWLRIHIKPNIAGDEVVGAQVIIDDVSEKKLLEEELRHLSITDNLTNAYNRRYFLQNLEKEIERSNRTGSQFSVIMMDIDYFKSINDCFGHNTGDLILKRITMEMMKSVRKIDTLARWGGEEFVFLLPETGLDKAVFLAEKLRHLLIRIKFLEIGNVTASFGVVTYHTCDTADKIIQDADNMMYKAKEEGRNCVRFVRE